MINIYKKPRDNYGVMPICKQCDLPSNELNRDGICC